MSEIVFNIIYTPGTVQRLAFMARSLLHWSDCSYRLISNGCTKSEQALLRSMCVGQPRLEYYALPTHVAWRHGRALDHLHTLSPGEHFGFLDSDIFACGEFMPAVLEARTRSAAVFSGAPPWVNSRDQVFRSDFVSFAGRYRTMDTGVEIGCSYFALYDGPTLDALIRRNALSFQLCTWPALSAEQQIAVHRIHEHVRVFDTTKLINMMLVAQGKRLEYVMLDHLIHLGGTSQNKSGAQSSLLSQIRSRLRHTLKHSRWLNYIRKQRPEEQYRMPAHQADTLGDLFSRRREVSSYFWHLLQALSTRTALPDPPAIADDEVRAKTHAAAAALIETHHRFAD